MGLLRKLILENSSISFLNKQFINQTLNQKKRSYIMHTCLPFFASGLIVKGFGRGSKELGIPTANYPLEVVKSLPSAFKTGIYYGWASLNNDPMVYKMVMSVGWNPYYDNTEKSMETHIMHKFNEDLYGRLLKVCIVGFLRPEKNFSSLDELITAIRSDIAQAEDLLNNDQEAQKLKGSAFFKECEVIPKDSNDDGNTKHIC